MKRIWPDNFTSEADHYNFSQTKLVYNKLLINLFEYNDKKESVRKLILNVHPNRWIRLTVSYPRSMLLIDILYWCKNIPNQGWR